MSRTGLFVSEPPRYRAGGRASADIRQRALLDGLLLRITGTVSVAADPPGGMALAERPTSRLIRQIIVSANGQDVQAHSGPGLAAMDELLLSAPYPSTGPGSAEAGDHDVNAYYFVPFAMPHSYTGSEWGLPSWAVDAPQITVDYGLPAEMFTGTEGHAIDWTEPPTVELYEVVRHGVRPGDRPAAAYHPLLIAHSDEVVTASATRHQMEIPHVRRGQELRAVLVEALAGGSGGTGYAYSDDLIARATLYIDGTPVVDRVDTAVLRAANVSAYDLDAPLAGVFLIDAAEDRRTGRNELYAIQGRERPRLELATAVQDGDNLVRVTTVATDRRGSAGGGGR